MKVRIPRITRNAKIIISMICEKNTSGIFIFIQYMTFSTHALISKQIHPVQLCLSKNSFTLHPSIIFRRKGVYFLGLLISS